MLTAIFEMLSIIIRRRQVRFICPGIIPKRGVARASHACQWNLRQGDYAKDYVNLSQTTSVLPSPQDQGKFLVMGVHVTLLR